MAKKKIVLIGATGKVGSQVTNALLAQNEQLTLIARHKDKLLPFEQKGANIIATSVTNVETVTEALKGADVVLTMIASNPLAEDFLGEQKQQANAQIEAIKKSGIKNVINLSSNGCHVNEGNGVIQGLSFMEDQLNKLTGVNIIHLRPTFYMENVFYALDLIKHKGIYGLPISPNKTFPMIATKDVATAIVEKINALDFTGKSVLPLLGDKDYSLVELTGEIGAAIGNPHLPYIQFPIEDFIGGIIGTGGTPDFANRFAELMVATDNGLLNTHTRNAANTTATSAKEFANTVFTSVYVTNKN
ncbi:MAG: NAD(P)H-binding protein [Chitinophagaceae bacterium]|nr:NAD(P)H-binding protein [Chitinophagaceae bacterium]